MKPLIKRKIAVVLFAAVCFLLMLNSCAKENPKNLPSLRLLNDITSNYTPVINLAARGGIAEKNGVYPILDYNDGIEPLLTGKVDGRLVDLIASLIAGSEGGDLVIFAGSMGGGHIVYANRQFAEELKNPENWKGKKIGARLQITPFLVLSYSIREKFGLKGDDVIFKYFDNDHAIMAACKNGDIDIGTTYYAYRETIESQGLVQIAELVDFFPDYACCRQSANGTKLRNDRKSFVNWTKSLIEAWKVYNSDEDRTIKLIRKVTKEDEQWVYSNIYDKVNTAHITFNPDPFYNGCLPQYEMCLENGYIDRENAKPIYDFFDISIYADALKEVITENPDDQFYKDMWTYFVEHNNKYPDFEKNYPKSL